MFYRDVPAATFAIAIAFPEALLGATTLAVTLELLTLAADFPIGSDIEVLGDRDERYLIVVRCIADREEILTMLDFV